ncbi:hypothetical protein PP298_12975 [Mycobacteroides abscessus]|uniref:hypothetical protein n=2 Tax=Mycobacteroides abscessus TaxID=36809 RepID=UPI00078D9562|nr:hypothetical protein [Mycobacteroides abscessus]AMU71070.1 hypothetical protein A3O05_14245 [Mycobacteroides abscessus]MDM2016266.1 hypothetical protein [Mycobacteroides abscessus]MDM2020882.1 hypothetical protein [Mycobacteroides abscessus]MDM2025965.1 hypothetical protein [Mycobacteroides abscessus]MDM2030289.1 hypothetical protein [Mycobacteroides abscessus]
MSRKLFAIAGAVAGLAISAGAALPAAADPQKNPYPDTSKYAKLDFEGFRIADKPGLWFSTPFGLDCGIWEDSSFGCTGTIPGAPGGANQIGWFRGDSAAHFDNTAQLRFSSGQAQRVLPANNYIELGSTRCATTPDNNVYCTGGSNYASYTNQFMVSAGKTWLGAQN